MMKSRRRLGKQIFAAAVLLLFAFCKLSFHRLPETDLRVTAYVYDSCGGCFAYNTPCKPCTVVLETQRNLFAAVKKAGLQEVCKITVENTLHDDKREELQEILLQAGMDAKTIDYPVVTVGGRILTGRPEIDRELQRALFTATGREPQEETEQDREMQFHKAEKETVVYFGMTSCSACHRAETIIETCMREYPDFIFKRYDIDIIEDWELLRQYGTHYNLDSNEVSVPVLFIGNKVLEGDEEIELFLKSYLDCGYAANTFVP